MNDAIKHTCNASIELYQNHDIIIKTNAQIAEIFETMEGANDMEMSR